MTFSSGLSQIDPVIDPGLSRWSRHYLLATMKVEPKRLMIIGALASAFLIGGPLASIPANILFPPIAGQASGAASAIIVCAGAASAVAWVATVSRLNQRRARQIVMPAELDGPCRMQLQRAQRAIHTVLGSRVYAERRLERAAGEAVLRAHEWEIAVTLREITRLGASVSHNAVRGPRTAAVLAPQVGALTLVQQAITARIDALEGYARPVEAAEAARRDWENALKASELNDQYLDLVARTGADKYALADLANLTGQAEDAERALQESLDLAILAAESLVLPQASEPRPAS